MSTEFTPFPKIPRLNRDIVITEKIDGTNAAIRISHEQPQFGFDYDTRGENGRGEPYRYQIYHRRPDGRMDWLLPYYDDKETVQERIKHLTEETPPVVVVTAQSRTRALEPTKGKDNFGFAAWVQQHRDVLVETLGPGLHFGEWWGSGIQRGYGLDHKRFSLFNTSRWHDDPEGAARLKRARARGVEVHAVPVLYTGGWAGMCGGSFIPASCLQWLRDEGSRAAPGYDKPEGIVVFHAASGTSFKATCEKDEQWKGVQ